MAVNHIWSKYKSEPNVIISTQKEDIGVLYRDYKSGYTEDTISKNRAIYYLPYESVKPSELGWRTMDGVGEVEVSKSYGGRFPVNPKNYYFIQGSVNEKVYTNLEYYGRSSDNFDCYYGYRVTLNTDNPYKKGTYEGQVKSSSRSAYPDDGEKDGYYYVYQGIDNQAPIINSSITNLGDVKENTSILFSVTDPENDAVTVEVSIDGIKTNDSPFVASNNKQYSVPITIAEYEFGSHRVEVKATDSKGGSTTKIFTFSRSNINPVISGQDTDLGDKNLGFTINFSVDDADLENTLTTTIKLNDKTLRTVSNTARKKEYSINITDGELFALAMNELNTLTIKVDDGAGGESYRYYYFKRANTAPTIETGSVELGNISKTPTIKFIASDRENDDLTYSVYLNDTVLVNSEPCERDKQLSYTIPKKEYSKLINGLEHKIKLIVSDIHKAIAIKTFTFKRELDACWHRTIKRTDGMKTLIHAYLNVQVADGAKLTVKVCNNALDENPTWEDATESFTNKLAYKIKNTSKIAENWAIGIEVRIDTLKATEPSWILGYGGSYKA